MGAGFVAILTVELHFPEAGSLKGKRHYVRSAKDTLRKRFGASVAEVDHHEADELAAGAERWLASGEPVLVRCERLLVSPGDEQ